MRFESFSPERRKFFFYYLFNSQRLVIYQICICALTVNKLLVEAMGLSFFFVQANLATVLDGNTYQLNSTIVSAYFANQKASNNQRMTAVAFLDDVLAVVDVVLA